MPPLSSLVQLGCHRDEQKPGFQNIEEKDVESQKDLVTRYEPIEDLDSPEQSLIGPVPITGLCR